MPASNEEQFRFLISCIRYSNNGKVDFSQVALECEIVSKGAAAKRYERMMRANGIGPTSVRPRPSRAERLESKSATSAPPAMSKKRKATQFLEDQAGADDDEQYGGNIKTEGQKDIKEDVLIKQEDLNGTQWSSESAANILQYYDTPSAQYDCSTPEQIGDDIYGSYDCNASLMSFDINQHDNYGMQGQPGYNYLSGYESAVPLSVPFDNLGSTVVPKLEFQNAQYPQISQYPARY